MWGRKRKVQNAAVIDMPAPPARTQNVTYDNRVPWVGIILITFFCFVMLFPFIWWSGVFLFQQYGLYEREARQAMAQASIGVAIIVFVFLILSAAGKLFLNNIFEHQERMEQYRLESKQVALEIERHRQLTSQAQPVQGGRITDEDKRWCQLITGVMFNAYSYYARAGQFTGVERPWSRRKAAAIMLRDGKPAGEAAGGKVKAWLEKRGIIENDQINVRRYPDLAAVEELLNREYNIPIQVIGNSPALLRSNEGYKHI